MQSNLQDRQNLSPDYLFILDNLSFLTTDVNWSNIKSKFPQRKKFSIKENQALINLKRKIVIDVSEGLNEFILFNTEQWQTIVDTIKEKEKETESAI
jgi:hypothetical protein